ncbi:MAG: glycine cleavage system aminomethyltransferase GcvT [Firmicutes bacterium]|nr:glycine cleavage system aminomethyltransferase GcvT [Bacillota bacterium]
MLELRRTPLYEAHVEAGGRIVDFGGWALPVQYTSILEEHRAVRERAGLFDVSHMGEIHLTGPDAMAFIQHLVTNDCSQMQVRQIVYSPMCYADGGVVDDILIYRVCENDYWLVVNASNTDKDYDWISRNASGYDVTVTNISAQVAQIAIQGPAAQTISQRNTACDLDSIKFFWCLPEAMIAGRKCLVSRTGYTGEDGFEIYCKPEDARHIWDTLLESGKADGLIPAGLGARDSLRFEAALPLYGHEISQDISPLEGNLGFFVKLGKSEFIGREALAAQKEQGLTSRVAGLELAGRGVPREGYPVMAEGREIGRITSGMFSPTFNKGLAMALISTEHARPGTALTIDIRGKAVPATVVKTPFYKKAYRKE